MNKHAKEEHQQPDFAKLGLFPWKVCRFLPSQWEPRLANIVVTLGGRYYWEAMAVVIATNLYEDDRDKAKDKELIEAIKAALDVKTDPGWYHPVRDSD